MTADVAQQIEARKLSPAVRGARELIEAQIPAFARLLGEEGAERFARVSLTELRRNPLLGESSQASLLGALMLCAQHGLEPGPLDHVYLIPRGGEVIWTLGYKGMVALCYRSGLVADVASGCAREGDAVDWWDDEKGTHFRIRATGPPERRAPLFWWARIRLKGGACSHRLWPEEVEARRSRSPAAQKNTGPWVTDFGAMARKSVIRAMSPTLPFALPGDELVARADTALDEPEVTEVTVDG